MRFRDEYMEKGIYLPLDKITKRRVLARFPKSRRREVDLKMRNQEFDIYSYAEHDGPNQAYKLWLDLGIENKGGKSMCLKIDNNSVTVAELSADKKFARAYRVKKVPREFVMKHAWKTVETVIASFYKAPVNNIAYLLHYRILDARKIRNKEFAFKVLKEVDGQAKLESITSYSKDLNSDEVESAHHLSKKLTTWGFEAVVSFNGETAKLVVNW